MLNLIKTLSNKGNQFKSDINREKLAAIRQILDENSLHGFIMLNVDKFQSEILPEHAKRIRWLTGFTGSNAIVIVLKDKAGFFTDGRYTLQASKEIDKAAFEIHNISDISPEKWLLDNIQLDSKIGFDDWLFSVNNAKKFRKALLVKRSQLIAISPNPVNELWDMRPSAPNAPAYAHKLEFSGLSHTKKIEQIAEYLLSQKLDATFIGDSCSVNWLFNIRGADLKFTPVCLCYGVIESTGKAHLFVDTTKLNPALHRHLKGKVEVREIDSIEGFFRSYTKNKRVSLDPSLSPERLKTVLDETGAEVIKLRDPCQLPKACKNTVEVVGCRTTHITDGKAVTNFIKWLKENYTSNEITELSAVEKLEEFRLKSPDYLGKSFDTISSVGENGAIIHYKPTESTNAKLYEGQIYLVDSGGQYYKGTTDVTRTIILGRPSEEMIRNFTLVLKGHIALANIKFPFGTTGSQLDILARQYLWQHGLDYDHGTGHGVGSYLNVHEGPMGISKRYSNVALEEGMIISNEPGYYKEGEYGIRIENLVLVKKSTLTNSNVKYLEFETLTKVPLDTDLIDEDMLTKEEKTWLKTYHASIK